MKVILTQDVKSVGKRGEVKNVSDGYARNFLLPKRVAVVASDSALSHEQDRLKTEASKFAKILDSAKVTATELEGKSVIVKSKAGKEGKLYGKITSKEIADAVKEQLGHDVDKRRIHIEDDIKTLGSYPISFKLHPEVVVTVTVNVAAVE